MILEKAAEFKIHIGFGYINQTFVGTVIQYRFSFDIENKSTESFGNFE